MADWRDQARDLQNGVTELLGDAVVGMYVHGSLALGCFNDARSDIDVLLVVARPLELEQKLALTDLLLRVSAAPYGIELHVLTTEQLQHWRHPSPFELHYGESHRNALAFEPVAALERMSETDADPAAPPETVLVPWEDYADALRRDLESTRTSRAALYGVLSPCRVWASLETGEVHSKASGPHWALQRLPAELRPQVERALAGYTGGGEAIELDADERRRLQAYIEERVS